MCRCATLLKAIEAYIKKVDDDLKDRLEEEGFAEAALTVEAEAELEEKIAETLDEEATALTEKLEENGVDLEAFYSDIWPELKGTDDTDEKIRAIFTEELEKTMPKLVSAYIHTSDAELKVTKITRRTTDWIRSWSSEIGEKMKLTTTDSLERILVTALDEGLGIAEVTQSIMDSGIRENYYRARSTAVTEILRAHSVSQQEARLQSPVVAGKKWRGGFSSSPRQNHLDMDGQIVLKNEPFEMVGKDGKTYYPQYPRDPILPVGETANCHCFAQDVLDTDMQDKPLKERQELQSKAVEEDDAAWEKELDERNKAKAGINEDTIKIDWLKAKPEDEQIRYFGSKNRWALFKSGVIQTDADLERLFTTKTLANGKTVRVRKPLKALKEDGIITIGRYTTPKGTKSCIKHSVYGDYSKLGNPKKPPSLANGGRPAGGGHTQAAIDDIISNGFTVNIEKTFGNGVRVGNIPEHTDKFRRTGEQMSWFPKEWDEDKVLIAGTYVANKPESIVPIGSNRADKSGDRLTAKYDGVTVCVTMDLNGDITSIYPANEQ